MIDRAVAVIKAGGVIVMPTDTVYGLACDPCNAAAVARIYAIKSRPDALELGLLGATDGDFYGLVDFNDVAIGLADRYWPGQLSLILPVAPVAPVASGAPPTGRHMVLPRVGSTLSVRVPDHALARALLAQTGPLATTSANRHGEPEAATAAEARKALGAVVDLVLDGGRALGTASTIIDCTNTPARLIRSGAISPTSPIPGVEADAFQSPMSQENVMIRTSTPTGALATYLAALDGAAPNVAATAYYASLDQVASVAPTVAAAIVRELADQRASLKLIASENYSSLASQLAHGNLLTDKYAEGYPGHRFYAGCDNVDAIESEAAGLACELFGADHAYVQPHSGADANLVAFLAILSARVRATALADLGEAKPDGLDRSAWEGVRSALHNQKLLALDFYSGGHLTHGYRHNISSMLFDVHTYSVERESKLIDLDKLRAQVHQVRPLILLAGYSAYPRRLNFAAMRAMADEVGAIFMVDMAHFAGLVAGGVFTGDYDPVRHAHIVTSTTHKTLRGPRGGLILCDGEFAEWVDKGCPAVLGGPLPHVMAAKAVAFREANSPEFATYARSIVDNSRALAAAFRAEGVEVVTGGTDNHLVLVDVAASYGLTGRQAESALRACNITLNRNALPFDQNGPWYTSGLRVGTPAATTRGLGVADMGETARIMASILRAVTPGVIESGAQKGGRSRSAFHIDADVRIHAREAVATLLERYPLYPELDMDVLTGS